MTFKGPHVGKSNLTWAIFQTFTFVSSAWELIPQSQAIPSTLMDRPVLEEEENFIQIQ